MTRPARTLLDPRVLLSISAAKAGPNEDAVAVRATWEQTFNSGDADKIAALYTKDAMMFGSTAQLFTGHRRRAHVFQQVARRYQGQDGRPAGNRARA